MHDFNSDLHFMDNSHEIFYENAMWDFMGSGCPFTGPAVYLLSASEVLREHFWEVYDRDCHTVKPDCWLAPWNTPETCLLIALAANITESPSEKGTLAPVILEALSWAGRLDDAMEVSPGFMDGPLI